MRVPELTPRAFRRLTLLNLVLLAIIIVTGAAVRLTDSGLGCSDWPNCNAQEFVSVGTRHQAIEQINRLFSGAIVIPILIVLVCSYGLHPRRRDFIRMSWLMLVLYLGNAVLGGISVLVKLAWVSVMSHFLLAIALVAVALTFHKRAGEPDGHARAGRVAPRAAPRARGVRADDLGARHGHPRHRGRPARGRRGGEAAQHPDPGSRAHPRGLGRHPDRARAGARRGARPRACTPARVLTSVSVALAAMVAQGILGYVQYARGIPELLVGFHVAGAVLVFGSVHWLLLEMHVPRAAVTPPVTSSGTVRGRPGPRADDHAGVPAG